MKASSLVSRAVLNEMQAHDDREGWYKVLISNPNTLDTQRTQHLQLAYRHSRISGQSSQPWADQGGEPGGPPKHSVSLADA